MNLNILNKPLKWGYLYEVDLEIEVATSALSKLNVNQEESLKSTKLSFNSFVEKNKKTLQSLPENERASYDFHLHYIDDRIINDLQRLQRYSIVIIIFSVFESRLLEVCRELRKEFPQLTQLNEINQKEDLKNSWKYLTKTILLNATKLQPLFQRFNQQKILRNTVTHHDGILTNKSKFNIINGVSLSDFGKNYIIEIEENVYVEYLLKYLKEFFKELTERVDDRYKELKINK
ncbi:hypothetical protein ACM55H_02000 [Flavobacterium sp. ZT3R17]|uniref:hypothetical protein n=1 Tax=Flavobacterium cryoconiti TaxID=3398736 RepID=UPI003A84D7B0